MSGRRGGLFVCAALSERSPYLFITVRVFKSAIKFAHSKSGLCGGSTPLLNGSSNIFMGNVAKERKEGGMNSSSG